MADTLSISKIRQNMASGGQRSTLFQISLTNPSDSSADDELRFKAFATTLPPFDQGVINIPYMGRTIKTPGDRVWQPWTVTFMDDEDWDVRNALEVWCADINTLEGNMRNYDTSKNSELESTGTITMLSKTQETNRIYTLHGVWPSNLGPVTFNWGAQNQIMQFDVTLQYDWMTISTNTSAGDTPEE